MFKKSIDLQVAVVNFLKYDFSRRALNPVDPKNNIEAENFEELPEFISIVS